MNTTTPAMPNEQATSKPRKYRRSGLTTADKTPDALKQFSNLPDDAHVGQPVVEGLFCASPATVWRHVKAGIIPAPRKFGGRSVWNVGQLRHALKG